VTRQNIGGVERGVGRDWSATRSVGRRKQEGRCERSIARDIVERSVSLLEHISALLIF
jgi:hypothetical protein